MTALWLSLGCVVCAIAGFSLVRLVAGILSDDTPKAPALPLTTSRQDVSPAVPAMVKQSPARSVAINPEPAPEKLELWARQIRAGERKMSLATDGCRVTWNRRCKHGHPTWLVELGYLSTQPAERTSS
jgi:hypothetical protein